MTTSSRVFTGSRTALSRSAPGAAEIARLSADVTHHSLIIFKNQLPGLPARGATASARITAADTVQAGVLAALRRVHAGHVIGFHLIDAVATISAAEAGRLATNPTVRAVISFTVTGDELTNIPYTYTVGNCRQAA